MDSLKSLQTIVCSLSALCWRGLSETYNHASIKPDCFLGASLHIQVDIARLGVVVLSNRDRAKGGVLSTNPKRAKSPLSEQEVVLMRNPCAIPVEHADGWKISLYRCHQPSFSDPNTYFSQHHTGYYISAHPRIPATWQGIQTSALY